MGNVYLDHLIPRESLRFIDTKRTESDCRPDHFGKGDFRLRDISEEWFTRLRKPDFQRETNSWTDEECLDFLDTVTNELVIPGVIVWKSDDSGLLFVIDGAHRLSVIRAWMTDDWGDGLETAYSGIILKDVIESAQRIRALVNKRIGSFADFLRCHSSLRVLVDQGEAPKKEMSGNDYKKAQFYINIQDGATIPTQWIYGSYEVAEQSFLKINKGGQKLDVFEHSLIEFRNGPYARVAMSVVNKGESGHYWPDAQLSDLYKDQIERFSEYASTIHNVLFVPPFDKEIKDLNQPLIISKPHQRYEDAVELIALIVENRFLISNDSKKSFLQEHSKEDSRYIIDKSDRIFKSILDRLSNVVGDNTSCKSLGIVPMVYTYNHQGAYSKNLLYAFLYWLFSAEPEIQQKKLALSAVRGMFEYVLMNYKRNITKIASQKGGLFKSTKDISEIINTIVIELLEHMSLGEEEAITKTVERLNYKPINNKTLKGRTVTDNQKNQINIHNLFFNSLRCPICGGVLDLQQGKQYDHYFSKFAEVKSTNVDNVKPTHPFCNNMKDAIEKIKNRSLEIKLSRNVVAEKRDLNGAVQLSLFDM